MTNKTMAATSAEKCSVGILWGFGLPIILWLLRLKILLRTSIINSKERKRNNIKVQKDSTKDRQVAKLWNKVPAMLSVRMVPLEAT